MLNAHRTLILASAARGALEDRFLRNEFPQQRRFAGRSFVLQVLAQSQDHFLGVELFPGIERRAMFRAASALHAGEGLQRVDPGDIFTGGEPEVLVAGERWNIAEAFAPRENS